jgi:GcrA cell cycle regulator
MEWTDERVEQLKKLWQEGLSASQIAKALGGVTRNAVIGKVHRLGLSGRAAPSQPARATFKPAVKAPRPAPAPAPVAARPALAVAPPPPAPVVAPEPPEPFVELTGTATVLTLGAHMCKWPIGDPSRDDFSFCGRRSADEGPYCAEHARVAYQPQQMKKKVGSELTRSLRRYL